MNIIDILFSLLRFEILSLPLDKNIKAAITPDTVEELYKISSKHSISHLISDALWKNDLLSSGLDVYTQFQEIQFKTIYWFEQMNYELNKICKFLEEAKIQFIPLKGAVIRKYYPKPWMRTSCDIDILVRRKEIDAACDCLEKSAGYRKIGRTTHDVSLMSPNGIHLELHFTALEEWCAADSNKVLSDIWKHASQIERTSQYYLDDEMFYFYHIAHMAKHFEGGGCGIRTFIDLWILNHKVKYDRNKRRALLEEGGLIQFADAAEKLSEVWFSNAEPDGTTEAMQDYIMQGGVYGSVKNRVAVKQNKQGGKLKYIFSRTFVPYKKLKDYYPKMGKYKILLPIMEIRRWGRIATGGRFKRTINELQTGNALSNDEKDNTKKLLQQLGLL